MATKEAYLEQVLSEVEEFAEKVAVLKARLAHEKPGSKLRYYWELEYLRNRFADFRKQIEQLEEADAVHIERVRESTESAWQSLKQAIETLLHELP
jgi:hypothetical protein